MLRAFIFALLALTTATVPTTLAQPIDALYEALDLFLAKHVDNGSVAYRPLQANPGDLDALISKIASFPYADLEAPDRQAFLINAYNLFTIKHVVDHYPLKSPLDILDFFDRPVFALDGKLLSLNALEKTELFARYNDPRMHFVLVCAATGCPSLMSSAYRGTSIDAQLEARTKLALDDPKHVRKGVTDADVQLSEIFSWYKDDFNREGSVIDYINRFRTSPIPSSATISSIPYDWQLNDLESANRR